MANWAEEFEQTVRQHADRRQRAARYAELDGLVRKDIPSPFPPPSVEHAAVMAEQVRRMVESVAARCEATQAEETARAVAALGSRYPHVCPRCSGPAYVGAVEVDCSRGCK